MRQQTFLFRYSALLGEIFMFIMHLRNHLIKSR